MSVRRSLRLITVGLSAVVVALALFAVVSTGKDVQPLASFSKGEDVASWSKPCWRRGSYTLPCARVHGRVVFRQSRDPDGDGDGHVVVVSGLSLVTLKIKASTGLRLPGYGAKVTAIGRYERGQGQLGTDVVNVLAMPTS